MRTLLILAAAACTAQAAAAEPAAPRHIKVYQESGRFGGWPANHGIWSWGNEIVVGFSGAWHQVKSADRHQADSSRPEAPYLARSLDGGETWTIERPASLLPPEQGGPPEKDLDHPIDFTAPGLAITLKFADKDKGPSRLWYSTDRARTWRGPYRFPQLGDGVAARTDVVPLSKHEALAFLTSAKKNGREGRPFCARTTDGGRSWKIESMIGPEPPGFSIMPSTVRLSKDEYLTTVRIKQEPENWIEQYRSRDAARSWTSEGRVAVTGAYSGNPPHLIRLAGGRLCLTYGYRSKPYSIRAMLSPDQGKTWSRERMLRDDGAAWDLGYVRSAQRPDGKVVTIYYFNDGAHNERFIAATIWDPGS